MNVLVETSQGIANICGDVVYDVHDQLIEPMFQVLESEPATTGNHGTTKRAEKAAIKKALNSCTFLLPVHDRPALIENGQVIGRLHDTVPGPIIQSLPKRKWFSV